MGGYHSNIRVHTLYIITGSLVRYSSAEAARLKPQTIQSSKQLKDLNPGSHKEPREGESTTYTDYDNMTIVTDQ